MMKLMKCDLHVHTFHSGMCTVPVAERFFRESYTDPLEVYGKLKRLGLNLVSLIESPNGEMVSRGHELAVQYTGYFRKTGLGGSYARTLASAGSSCTAVRGARNKREILDGIRGAHRVAPG